MTPPTGPHPLVAELMHALTKGMGEPRQVPPTAIDRFLAKVKAVRSGAEVYGIVGDAVRFAAVLEKGEKSPKASAALLAALEPAIAHLETLARTDGEKGSQHAEDLRKSITAQKKALERGPGVAVGLKPGAGMGVGLRKR